MNKLMDQHEAARAAIVKHTGYIERYKLIPLNDRRDHYWGIVGNEFRHSPKRECLEYWMQDNDDEYGLYGDYAYSSQICGGSQPRIYRGAEIVAVEVDTGCDGNQWLEILDPAKEVVK